VRPMGLWYVSADGADPLGPFEDELIERGVRAGKIPLDATICPMGGSEWLALTSTPRFAAAVKDAAPPPPPPRAVRQAMLVSASQIPPDHGSQQPSEPLPTPQVEASFDPNPNAEHSATSGSPQGALKVAVFLTGLTALFWLGIVLIQCVLFIATQKSETAMLALWNSLIVAMNVWIATALWRRKPVGYSWGLGTHSLNALLGVYQVFSGAPLLILVVPLHAISAVAIWRSHAQFPTPTPAQGQQAPGFSFKRVLIAVGGFVVTIITVSLIVIMLNN